MKLDQVIKVLMDNVPAKEGRDEIIAELRAGREWLKADDASTVPRPHEDHVMHLAREAYRKLVESP